jgi:hypothetical protein
MFSSPGIKILLLDKNSLPGCYILPGCFLLLDIISSPGMLIILEYFFSWNE